ncbi:MAG: hypA [Phycisphaerales bacterium]|nr:hypA [Phycisphaerales bacterium]
MHELSIAMSIIDVAAEEAERTHGTVVAVHLRLGPLSGVVKDALVSAYELAREGSPLAQSRLVIQEMPLIAWCPLCRCEQHIESVQWICCPACNTPTPDVRGGRDLDVVGLEVLDDAADAHDPSPADGARAQ